MTSRAIWQKRVSRWRESGKNAAEFAATGGFSPQTLKWWASRLNREVAFQRRSTVTDEAANVQLVRVVSQQPAAVSERGQSSGLALEVGIGRLVIETGFDQATLAAVLEVLAGPGGRRP
jgi:hypothetical protein